MDDACTVKGQCLFARDLGQPPVFGSRSLLSFQKSLFVQVSAGVAAN